MAEYEQFVGQVFDSRYKIQRVIGIGGMAVVFEAFDFASRNRVAVKMLKTDIAGDAESLRRFINESRAVSLMNHRNIVKIYNVSVNGPYKFIVMELIEGITLKNYIQQKGQLPVRELLSISAQILSALTHAHEKGVIHRDIKPQNILILKDGTVKVTDFGIAKLSNADTVTLTDKAIGTVYYISPEQASGRAIDARSDLYSLGVVMYEMATGVLPFTGNTPVSVALMQVSAQPRPPRDRNPSIPVGLEQVILGAMEKKPEHRFQSASQMLHHVQTLQRNPRYVFKSRAASQTKTAAGPAAPVRRRHASSMLPNIIGVAAALVIVVAIAGIYILTNLVADAGFNDEKRVTVPSLTGGPWSDALRDELEEQGFSVSVKTVYNAAVEENTVIEQEPEGGVIRKVIPGRQKTPLEVKVSMGAEGIVLKDYTVLEWRSVEADLKSLGLRCVKNEKTSEYHQTIPEGCVIRTEPVAGTVLHAGDSVKLIVSRGEEITYTLVPYFIGFDEKNAYAALKAADLVLGSVTYEHSEEAPGIIIAQGRSAGIEVPAGVTKIDFTVSLGPETEE